MLTRRNLIGEGLCLAAVLAARQAEAILIGNNGAMMTNGNKEEEMYKELYENLLEFCQNLFNNDTGDDGKMFSLTDPNIVSVKRAFGYGIYANLNLPNIETTGIGSFNYYNGYEINLSKCVSIMTYGFRFSNKLKTVRLPRCTTIGNEAFSGCVNLKDVYIDSLQHTSSGFPWGCNSANTVFHCSDGNYDYQGRELN